ncbi:MAG TPA: HIT family protein [Candidatus Eremiobacteraeota bacterium]|nr:MAG: AP-4-A phosphorylase [bacterium ADurb.Bin363]HPZ09100.1 HIT family protein [Candidatus Eremiobacteraeota bacterium]
MKECPFCNHKEEESVLKNELCFARFDKYPVSKGHLLVIPWRHFDNYFDATREEKIALIDLIDEARNLLDKEFNPDGYNIGVNIGIPAGQSVMHLHIHIIPRYIGDTENPRGGVRGVLPRKRNYRINSE